MIIRFVINYCFFVWTLISVVLLATGSEIIDLNNNANKGSVLAVGHANNYYHRKRRQSHQSTNRCFSCMNTEFDDYWDEMQIFYVKPVNFTDSCLSLPAKINIGFVLCDGACIVIKEQRLAGGSSHSYNVVRGCINSVTRSKISPSVINFSKRSFSSRNICQVLEAKDLFADYYSTQPRKRTKDDEAIAPPIFPVTVCTCYGHLCNSEPIAGSQKLSAKIGYRISWLVFVLISMIEQRFRS